MNEALVMILLIVNTAITVILTRKYCDGRLIGQLRIDRSDPQDEPYIFAELFKGVGDISKMKYVTFEVCNKSYLPPE